MMHCQDLCHVRTKPVDDTIITKDDLADSRIVYLRDNSSKTGHVNQMLSRLKDIHYEETCIVWGILSDEFSNSIQVVCRLRCPPHFNHLAILSLT